MNIRFSVDPCNTPTSALAIAVSESDLAFLTETLGDTWTEVANLEKFTGKAGKELCYPSFGQVKADRLIIVGTGKGDLEGHRQAARAVGLLARKKGIESLAYHTRESNSTLTQHIIRSISAGNYLYDRFKLKADQKSPLSELILFTPEDNNAVQQGLGLSNARSLARDLVNGPADVIYPESLADAARALANDNISVEVWDEKKIKDAGMGGITAVGQGSSKPARFIHLHYRPKGTPAKKIALIGKGVTFDAGGLSLKSSAGMQTMRCDMAGSAVVLGVFKALQALTPDVEVHGLIGAVENMCGANSFKLGDILHMYNGKTVEIHNTDAEGRLVMADCLSYGSKLGADYMLDIATLTGACVVALGEYYSGLFTNSDELAEQLLTAAENNGEGLWRMPLPDFYKSMLKSDWAHVKNVGGRAAGSITAALFLKEFVSDTTWAHIDIAGPAFHNKTFQHYTSGGSGAMVESLSDWICSFSQK